MLELAPPEAPPAPPIPIPRLASTTSVIDRARRYLDKCAVAISGAGGHNTTFLVAQKLVRGFCLDEEVAYSLLCEWNARCEPPWSERELRRKVREAALHGALPPGTLLARSR